MAIEARLRWRSPAAAHVDRLILAESALQAHAAWAQAARQLQAGAACIELDAMPWCQPAGQAPVTVAASQVRLAEAPVPGRFYPRMVFAGLARGPRDMQPVRVEALHADHCRVDPNHPLSAWAPRLELNLSAASPAPGQRLAQVFDGPGLQVPAADPAAAYFAADARQRQDEADDAEFYRQPRLVHHLDAACRAELAALYGRFLVPGWRVLDLMSSWESHLPARPDDLFVAGLGLNAGELAANPRLGERVVKDLNQRSGLPWADAQFDLVCCSASIEYLLDPLGVLAEVRRVLRPGGQCVIAFSDRWFATKAIRVWGRLHPFERVGLVISLLAAAGFGELHSESLRGLARPADDKYAAQRSVSDPLFAVWGKNPG